MGLIGRLIGKRAPATPFPGVDSPSIERVYEAIVRTQEAVVNRYQRRTNAAEVTKRIHGTAYECSNLLAKVMDSVPLRLYTSSRRAGATMNRGAFKTLTHSRAAWLLDPRVGRKAVGFAESAGEAVEVMKHPILDLLQRPEPGVVGSVWNRKRWRDKFSYGNALAVFVKDAPALIQLMPQFVTVQPSEESLIAGYWYQRDETDPIALDRAAICHWMLDRSDHNPYWGMGVIERLFREQDLMANAMAAEIARWENGGAIGGIIGVDSPAMTQEQADQIYADFNRRHGGPKKAGRWAVAGGKVTLEPLANPHEMQYREGMEIVDRRIYNAFGIPESIWKMNDANRASAWAGNDQFVSMTVQPSLSSDAEEMTELLLPLFGIEPGTMWFAYDDVSPVDRDALRNDVAAFVPLRVWNRNEARRELGFDPIEGGDEFEAPLSQFGGLFGTGDRAGDGSIEDKPDKPSEQEEPERKSLLRKSWGQDRYGIGDCCGHSHKQTDPLGEFGEAIRRAVQRWLLSVAASLGLDGDRPRVVIDTDELNAALRPVIERLFADGMASGAVQIGADPAEPFRVGGAERALDALNRHLGLVIEQVSGTTQNGIREAIARGIDEGMPLSEVIDELKREIGDEAGWRAERIARTETAHAQNAGRVSLWGEHGYTTKSWGLAPGACSLCVALKRAKPGEIPLTEPFAQAGDVIRGDDGREYVVKFPVYFSPLHPNDRCVLEPGTRPRGDT